MALALVERDVLPAPGAGEQHGLGAGRFGGGLGGAEQQPAEALAALEEIARRVQDPES